MKRRFLFLLSLLSLCLAESYAQKWNATLVLKGAGTIIASPDGDSYVNPTGNPGLAAGGSGDVLAGMVAAWVGQGYPPDLAAALGVYLHGKAADLLVRQKGMENLVAGDLPHAIGHTLIDIVK